MASKEESSFRSYVMSQDLPSLILEFAKSIKAFVICLFSPTWLNNLSIDSLINSSESKINLKSDTIFNSLAKDLIML